MLPPAHLGRWLAGLGALLVTVAYVAVALPPVDALLLNLDHGNQLAKATQISLGRHPFVDFHNGVYGPLVFYGSHVGQVLSGGLVLGEVVLLLVGYAVAYALLLLLLRRVVDRGWLAWALWLPALLLMPRFYKYYIVLGPMVFVTALRWAAFRRVDARSLVGLALAIDALALYRLDFGAYGVVTAVVCIAVAGAGRRPAVPLTSVVRLLGWCLLFVSPWLLFLAREAELLEVVRTSVGTARGVAGGLQLELPAFDAGAGVGSAANRLVAAFWSLRLAPLLALVWIAARYRSLDDRERMFGIGLALFAALVFLQASHRIDRPHLLQVLPVQLVLLGWLATRVAAARPWARVLHPAACALVVVPCLLLVEEPPFMAQARAQGLSAVVDGTTTKLRGYAVTTARLRGPAPGLGGVLGRVAAFVHDATSRDTGVLFLPHLPQLYYVADRGFTTSFGWLHPGRFPRDEDQDEFIRSMATTRVVADWSAFLFDGMPERNARVYAGRLMRYVYESYGIVRQIGPVYILTDDPAVLARHGAFAATYARLRVSVERRTSGRGPAVVADVNTLPVRAGGVARTLRGGVLIVALRARTPGALAGRAVAVGLQGDGGTFAVQPPGPLQPVKRGGVWAVESAAGTRNVPPGTYEIVVLERAASDGLVAHPTGTRLVVVAPARSG